MTLLRMRGWKTLINFSPRVCAWLIAVVITSSAYANPVINNVAAGNVTVQQTSTSTVVNQQSQKAIINWQSFNIGQHETTHFQQPAGGVALNRISPTQGPSSVYGQLTATGQIILINPAGVFFGPTAFVNVGGMIATTSNITDQNFLNGYYHFDSVSPYAGSIINEGQLIAANNGLIALIGSNVINNGHIEANLGHIVLASGSAFTMSFAGNDLISFSVDGKTLSGQISNTGSLIADGGKILVTAETARGVLDTVINMQGVAQARSVDQKNGEIIFSANNDTGVVRISAKVDVSGKQNGSKGGNVIITGHNILIDDATSIDVSGDTGGGNINIGGNYQGLGVLPNANALVIASNVNLHADAITSGNGGNIILWSDKYTNIDGNLSARGGNLNGNGGFVETSSHQVLNTSGILVDLSAPQGKTGLWLLDPWNVTINAVSTTNGLFDGGNPNIFTPTNTATILNSDINTNLATADVTITTSGAGGDAGDITVNAPIFWNNATTLTLLANNSIIINAAITISNASASLILNAPGSITQTTTIDGSGSLIKQGTGTLTLSQANTYAGTTTVTAGILSVTNNAGLGTTAGGTTVASGATLNINGLSSFPENIILSGTGVGGLGALTGSGDFFGNITLAGDTTINTSNFMQIDGAINESGGSWALTKIGSNALLVSNASTYSGSTTINVGYFITRNATALGTSGNTFVADGATLDINGQTITGQTLTITGTGGGGNGALVATTNGGSFSGTITLLGDTTFGGSGNPINISANISGPFSLTKIGTAPITLSGTNTYTGTTTINAGTLILGTTNALPIGTGLINNGLLNLNGNAQTVASITGSGVVTSSTAANFTINNNASDTYTGTLSGSLALIKLNTGTLTLSNSNTYSGGTTLSDGVINIGGANSLGSGTLTLGSGTTFDIDGISFTNNILLDAATLTLTNSGSLIGEINLATGTSNTITANAGSSFSANNNINGAGNLIINGTGRINISGDIGNLTPATSLNIANTNPLTSISGSVYTINNQTYTNPITLSANTTFSSSNGNLVFNNSIDGGYNLSVTSGGTSTFAGVIGTSALASLNITASTIQLNAGSVNTIGNQTYNGSLALGIDTSLTVNDNSATISINNGVSGNKNLTLSSNVITSATYILNGSISANTVAINGNNGTTNTLSVNSGSAQTWNVTSNNAGNLTGVAGVTGSFNFSDIGNLTGGTTGNNFIFSDGASINGTINGNTLNTTNTLNYNAYSTPITIRLASTNNGYTQNNLLTTITNFSNITNIAANGGNNNALYLPNKNNFISVTQSRQATINDPIYVNGISSFYSTGGSNSVIFNVPAIIKSAQSAVVNGITMYFYGINLGSSSTTTTTGGVSPIIQQPITNVGALPDNHWINITDTTGDINKILADLDAQLKDAMDKLTIVPNCFGGA